MEGGNGGKQEGARRGEREKPAMGVDSEVFRDLLRQPKIRDFNDDLVRSRGIVHDDVIRFKVSAIR
jgi:hypothetical protein